MLASFRRTLLDWSRAWGLRTSVSLPFFLVLFSFVINFAACYSSAPFLFFPFFVNIGLLFSSLV